MSMIQSVKIDGNVVSWKLFRVNDHGSWILGTSGTLKESKLLFEDTIFYACVTLLYSFTHLVWLEGQIQWTKSEEREPQAQKTTGTPRDTCRCNFFRIF